MGALDDLIGNKTKLPPPPVAVATRGGSALDALIGGSSQTPRLPRLAPPTSDISIPETGAPATKYFPSMTEKLADLQLDPLSLKENPTKVFSDYWHGIKDSIIHASDEWTKAFGGRKRVKEDKQAADLYQKQSQEFMDRIEKAKKEGGDVERIQKQFKTFTENAPEFDLPAATSKRIGSTLSGLAGTAGAVLSPVTSLFSAAENVPVVGSVSKLVSFVFGALGDAGRDVAYPIVNQLPISKKAKENIVSGVGDVLGLALQVVVGKAADVAGKKYLPSERKATAFRESFLKENPDMKQVNEIGTNKINSLVKKYGEADAQTIVKQALVKAGAIAKIPVFSESSVTDIPIETAKTRYAEYIKEQGYEPYAAEGDLPTIPFGSKLKTDLPAVDGGSELTTKMPKGDLTYEPIKQDYQNLVEQSKQKVINPKKSPEQISVEEANRKVNEANTQKIVEETVSGERDEFRLDNDRQLQRSKDYANSDIPQDATPDTEIPIYRVGKPGSTIGEGDHVGTSEAALSKYLSQREGSVLIKSKTPLKNLVKSNGTGKEFIYAPKKGVSKVGGAIEARAIENKLTKGFKGTAEFDPVTIKEQAKLATDLVTTDIGKAKKIISGQEQIPFGLRERALIDAMEEWATKNDPAYLLELAKSPLVAKTSLHAQELALGKGNPDSPLTKIKEIQNVREDALEKRLKGKDITKEKKKIVNDIKKEVKKKAPTKEDWSSFIRNIEC